MKRLLMVIDMQNDFISGSLGNKEAEAIVPAVLDKIMEYEKNGDEVIFTLDTHQADYLNTMEGKRLPIAHCIKNTPGWQLHKELEGFLGRRFEKNTFGSLDCMKYVADGNYDSVELIGLCTDICVISNGMLIKAACPELPVTVDSACCAGVTTMSHQNALSAMEMCHITII